MRNVIFLICFSVTLLVGCKTKTSEVDLKIVPVRSGDYWGFIDHEGKFKINPQFKYAYAFNEDLALVKSSDDKYGFINSEGKYAINASFKSALSFSEGLALVVRENTQLEYVDKVGKTKLILPPEIERAYSFTDGLAVAYANGLFGYVDKEGKTAIPFKFNNAFKFSEGFARVAIYDSTARENKWGFINKKGELSINYQFSNASDFSNGLALIYNGKQYGYIDKEGKFVVNPQFDYATPFQGDYAVIKQGELYGYIDKQGKIIINPQFKEADFFFNNDLAAVLSTDGKYGFIDKEGKFSINPQFDYVSRYYGDISIVKMAKKYGIVDTKGKIIVNPQFDDYTVRKDDDNWIYSDYFDLTGVINYIIEGTSATSFQGFSSTDTYISIASKFPGLNQNNFNSFTQLDDGGRKNKFIKLSKLSFDFLGELTTYNNKYTTQQVYDPVAGGYTSQQVYAGSEPSINQNAVLSGVNFYYNLGDKALVKRDDVLKEAYNKLKSQYSLNDGPELVQGVNGINYILKNNKYSITLSTLSTDGYGLAIYCTFNNDSQTSPVPQQ